MLTYRATLDVPMETLVRVSRWIQTHRAGAREAGWAFVCLDGTLIQTSRSSARSAAGHDTWYSGKHHAHGGNVQVLTDPSGFPVWTSPVEPGSTHDITAAREHAFPALYPAAARQGC